jgi:type I restriction enzyme R subunit
MMINLIALKKVKIMHSRLTENTIEEFTIKLLEHLGYQYIYAPNIAHDGENPERSSYEEILLAERLKEAIRRINPTADQ